MNDMLVKNWKQGYKSLAVWLPVLASGLYVVLKQTTELELVPESFIPLIVGITGVLGWVTSQDKTPLKIKE